MKQIMFSGALALLALFSASNSFAQKEKANPHFNPQSNVVVNVTCQPLGNSSNYKICVNGTVYGIGDATTASLNYVYNLFFNCYNRGADSGPVPGQTGNMSGNVPKIDLTNIEQGHADFAYCFIAAAKCKGGALGPFVTGIDFSSLNLVIQGTTLNLLPYLDESTIQNCDRPAQ